MTPFIYPKIKHKRLQNPPSFSDYHKFKSFLQIEFESKCIYCREPDFFKGYNEFGVDHYNPDKNLKIQYSNLFYCCNNCNRLKNKFWPNAEQKKELIFIPNPCDHIMFDNLQFNNESVIYKTNAGKHSIELLKLNSKERVKFRKTINITISKLISLYIEYKSLLSKLEVKIKLQKQIFLISKLKKKRLIVEKIRIEEEIDQIKIALSNYLGTPITIIDSMI